MSTEYIQDCLQASIVMKQAILADAELLSQINQIAELALSTYKQGGKILIAGNGGSAADAQHIAAELVVRFETDRPGLPAIALTTDSSILTATGNDYGYEFLFSRQVEALALPGDLLIGISTSGNSANILRALTVAKDRGVKTVGMTGQAGGKMRELCDLCFCAPSTVTARVQEAHIVVGHILCGVVERHYVAKETLA